MRKKNHGRDIALDLPVEEPATLATLPEKICAYILGGAAAPPGPLGRTPISVFERSEVFYVCRKRKG